MRLNRIKVFFLLPLILVLAGCEPPEQTARDTMAALSGSIVSAQATYKASCVAAPNQTTCITINDAIAANNSLGIALDTYCGWSVQNPPPDPTTPCVPVKDATSALNAAIANANQFIMQIKSIQTGGTK